MAAALLRLRLASMSASKTTLNMVSRPNLGMENRSLAQTLCDHVLPKYNFLNLLIWSIGIMTLLSITIKDVLPLLTEYAENNVAINAQVVVMDESFRPPQIALAIPHYKVQNKETESLMRIAKQLLDGREEKCEECAGLMSKGWDVWNRYNFTRLMRQSIDKFYQALSLSFMKELASKNGSELLLQERRYEWTEPIFSAALNFYGWRFNIDYGDDPTGEGALANGGYTFHLWSQFDIAEDQAKMESLSRAALIGLCRDLSYEELKLSNEFETPTPTGATCSDLLTRTALPVNFGTRRLWTCLPHLDSPRMREYRFTFSRNESWYDTLWLPKPDTDLKFLEVFPDPSVQYVSYIDSFFSSAIVRHTVGAKGSGLRVTLKYSPQMRAKETRSKARNLCYNGTSASVCVTVCTKQYVIETCGCVPFSMKEGLQYDQGMPYCDTRLYAACNLTSLPEQRQAYCLDKCKTPCDYTSYNWHVDHQKYKAQNPNTTEITLQMVPIFNTFAEFSWVYKSTQEQFLSQIGGIVNLYLGISGLSVFAFITALVTAINQFRIRKSIAKDQVQRTEDMQIQRVLSKPGCNGDWAKEKWFKELVEAVRSHLKEEALSSSSSDEKR